MSVIWPAGRPAGLFHVDRRIGPNWRFSDSRAALPEARMRIFHRKIYPERMMTEKLPSRDLQAQRQQARKRRTFAGFAVIAQG
ncbi:hypothetical protein MXAZACID_02690 [Acidocella sp. MX-AZ02]|nr:hypothetical protein MXAZACID_02690 [Acidocella sp. MX-AZ02]